MTETSKPSTPATPATKDEWLAATGARRLTRDEVVAVNDGTAARKILHGK